jgi:hypothetical protein
MGETCQMTDLRTGTVCWSPQISYNTQSHKHGSGFFYDECKLASGAHTDSGLLMWDIRKSQQPFCKVRV